MVVIPVMIFNQIQKLKLMRIKGIDFLFGNIVIFFIGMYLVVHGTYEKDHNIVNGSICVIIGVATLFISGCTMPEEFNLTLGIFTFIILMSFVCLYRIIIEHKYKFIIPAVVDYILIYFLFRYLRYMYMGGIKDYVNKKNEISC